MEEQLEKFLKENGVFDRFWANAKDDYADVMYVYSADLWILRAFGWIDSPEGFEFWSDIDDMWQDKISELIATEDRDIGFKYMFPQYSKSAVLSNVLHRGDKIYLSEILNDSTLPKTAVVDELIHGKGYVEVYLR
jgi:hypothetical protein